MRINVGRGLFRLWVVGSALWLIVIAVASAGTIREEFAKARSMRELQAASWEPDVPSGCAAVRGEAGTDYRQERGVCWYSLKRFRALYPEYNDLKDDDLSERLYRKAGMPLTPVRPWGVVSEKAALGFGPPIALWLIGSALAWALAGFRKAKAI